MFTRYVAIAVLLAVVIGGSFIYVMTQQGGVNPTETTTETATPTTTPSTENIVDYMKKLGYEVLKLRNEGYATVHMEYLLLSAKYHYLHGDISKTLELLNEVSKELESPELLPELPITEFEVADGYVNITRAPTVEDFVPIGKVFVLTSKGYLDYPRNDPQWKLSCFIMLAIGKSEDGKYFMYQGRLPLKPEEGSFRPRVFIGGKWVILNITFAGPLYYDDGEKFRYPTVYQYDISGRYMQWISYDPEGRRWFHAIKDLESGTELISIKAKVVSPPTWLGQWGSLYLAHGVYPKRPGVDLWSGFWDICEASMKVTYNGITKEYHGLFVFDRASHRIYGIEDIRKAGPLGAPLEFSCMVIYQDNLVITVAYSRNPSTLNLSFPLQHQLRVELLDRNLTLITNDIVFREFGNELQPSEFHIIAKFNDKTHLDIKGKVVNYWPPRWVGGRGTWWNPKGAFTWGRAFTVWEGGLVINSEYIPVNAVGVGEFTRYSEGQQPEVTTCPLDGSCWK